MLRRLFNESRGSAVSQALMLMMRELRHQVGRFNVCRLMKVAGRTSRQPGDHAYKVARAERPDIPNLLAREFVVPQLNQVWCGVVILLTCGPVAVGIIWRRCWTFISGGSWAGQCLIDLMLTWQ